MGREVLLMDSPCKGCDERTHGCHGICTAYKKWKAEDKQNRIKLDKDLAAGRAREGGIRRALWRN